MAHHSDQRRDRTSHARRPLVVTADEALLDELLRLAAAADVEVDVATDPPAARGRYTTASLVVIGADQAQPCRRARLPGRPDVVLVTAGGDDEPEPWAHAEALGAGHVAVLPAAEPWLVDRFARSGAAEQPAPVVGVVGGRGGAGASVLATGLATTALHRGWRVLLVDGDPLGGGLDLVMGWEDEHGVRWPEFALTDGRVPGDALVGALPGRGDLALLSFDREQSAPVSPEAMSAVLAAGRGARDLVIVDLPRHLDAAAEVALQAARETLLVVPAEVRAVTAASRVAAQAGEHCERLRVVVRGPSPGRLSTEDVGSSLRLPVAGSLRPEAGLPAAVEGGMPPTTTGRGPLAMLCRQLVEEFCRGTAKVAA